MMLIHLNILKNIKHKSVMKNLSKMHPHLIGFKNVSGNQIFGLLFLHLIYIDAVFLYN